MTAWADSATGPRPTLGRRARIGNAPHADNATKRRRSRQAKEATVPALPFGGNAGYQTRAWSGAAAQSDGKWKGHSV
jgi:hypothetical protein